MMKMVAVLPLLLTIYEEDGGCVALHLMLIVYDEDGGSVAFTVDSI
jgi:hypothetical protein